MEIISIHSVEVKYNVLNSLHIMQNDNLNFSVVFIKYYMYFSQFT